MHAQGEVEIMEQQSQQHALVIGGSMAGLLAARVLADHFAQVTLVERDQFPDQPAFRAGVPQGRHLHVLLMRGRQIIETLLPGFTQRLITANAQDQDSIKDMRLYIGNQWAPSHPSTTRLFTCSRPLIDWVVRDEIAYRGNITFTTSQDVIGLLATADDASVTGVRVRARNGSAHATGTETELRADLVVDASGRHSQTPQWLQALGYAAPPETKIDPHLGYATRIFRLPPQEYVRQTAYILTDPPRSYCGGVIAPLEHDREWIVTLVGTGGHYPPTDEAGYMEFARQLPAPDIYDLIKDAEPISPISGYRDTQNQWRHYEKMARFPDGLILVGDAVTALDPVYGQGMSVAAMDAELLQRQLASYRNRSLRGFARQFQRALGKQKTDAWQLSATPDLNIPTVAGAQPTITSKLTNAYLERIALLVPRMRRAQVAFIEVAALTAPATALFHPAIVARALTVRRTAKH